MAAGLDRNVDERTSNLINYRISNLLKNIEKILMVNGTSGVC